jgi:hypothetical protein
MLKLKQGSVAVALVVSLGLIVPGSFGGLASAERNLTDSLTVQCDALGPTVYVVDATDHNPGGTLPTMQVQDGSLVFVPIYGELTSTYTALGPTGDKPSEFDIAPGEPYAFHDGVFQRGNLKAKRSGQNLITCTITDDSANNIEVGDSSNNPLFADDVEYHYTDVFTMQTLVTSTSGASFQAASADDDQHKAKKGGKHKANKGGKHRGEAKRGR